MVSVQALTAEIKKESFEELADQSVGEKSNLIDDVKSSLIDGVKSNLIDGVKLNLIDGAKSNLLDGAKSNLIDGAKSNLIDGAKSNLIDGNLVEISDKKSGEPKLIAEKMAESRTCTDMDAAVEILESSCTTTMLSTENTESGRSLFPSGDTTDSSSSFGETDSSSDETSLLKWSDAEANSQYLDNNRSMPFMRKKLLTADWRRYRNPIMWRSRWLELRMNEMKYQAAKYDMAELELQRKKAIQSVQDKSEGSVTRAIPFRTNKRRIQLKMRRRRKKLEDTDDTKSLISFQSLISYYEKKKLDMGAIPCDDECSGAPVTNEEENNLDEFSGITDWVTLLQLKEGDNAPELLLWKLEGMRSRVSKLKLQLNKILLKHVANSSTMENSSQSILPEPVTSSAQSPAVSPGHVDAKNFGTLYPPFQQFSDYETGEQMMPGSAVSSYAEDDLADLDDSGNIFSLADIPFDDAEIGDSCGDIFDEVLIDNQVVGEDLQDFEVCHYVDRHLEVKEEEKPDLVPPVSTIETSKPQPDSEVKVVEKGDTLPGVSSFSSLYLGNIHVPKNKRNRTGRRPASDVRNGDNPKQSNDQQES